jgi:hypothetical protein
MGKWSRCSIARLEIDHLIRAYFVCAEGRLEAATDAKFTSPGRCPIGATKLLHDKSCAIPSWRLQRRIARPDC